MVNVREELLMELESLVEARARIRYNRSGADSHQAFRAAVAYETGELASILWQLLDEREKGSK